MTLFEECLRQSEPNQTEKADKVFARILPSCKFS